MTNQLNICTLIRNPSTEHGTFGKMYINGTFFSHTLERPWLDNKSGTSSIPTGTYRTAETYSPRFRRQMYLLFGTGPRTGIRIHAANLSSQLQGCIALGHRLGAIGGKPALLISSPAIREFESKLEHKPFILEIRNA